jgi:hypothetical protein
MFMKSVILASTIATAASIVPASSIAGPYIDPNKAQQLNDAMNGNQGLNIDKDKAQALQDAMNNNLYIDPDVANVLRKSRKHKLKFHAGAISCAGGKQIVRNHGFRKVRPIDCSGRTFTYLGKQHGDVYAVVLSRSGRIIDVSELSY